MICITPINHVHNLDEALNKDNNPQTLLITDDRPLPADHAIVNLTNCFRFAIRAKASDDIQPLNESYLESMKSNPEFHQYDRSELRATRQIALDILISHIAASTLLPASPPQQPSHRRPHSTPVCQCQAPQTRH